MKNIARSIIILMLGFTACNDDFLEYKPDNAFTAEDRIANKLDLLTYMNGAYDALSYSASFGGQFSLISELMADGVDMSRSDNGDWQAHYSRTTDIFLGTTRTMIETSFKAVGRVNNVLLNMPRISDMTAVMSDILGILSNTLFTLPTALKEVSIMVLVVPRNMSVVRL